MEIDSLMGISVRFTDAQTVRARYEEIYAKSSPGDPGNQDKRRLSADTALRNRKERETSACSPSKPTARVENLTLSHRNKGLSIQQLR